MQLVYYVCGEHCTTTCTYYRIAQYDDCVGYVHFHLEYTTATAHLLGILWSMDQGVVAVHKVAKRLPLVITPGF